MHLRGRFHCGVVVLIFSCVFNLNAQVKVPYCVDPEWLPYEAIVNNKHIGFSSDYIKLLDENTSLDFELIISESWAQSIEFIKSGKCYILPMLNKTNERDEFLSFSDIYFTSSNFLVSNERQSFLMDFEQIDDQILGLISGYRMTKFVNINYPNIKTKEFSNQSEALLALSRGEIDLFTGSIHSLNHIIQTLGLTNLHISGWGGAADEFRFGVNKNHQHLLLEINQALKNITQEQHVEIYNRWNSVKVIEKTSNKLIVQILIATLLLLIIFIARYFSIKNYNNQLTEKNEQLNKLQNEILQSNQELKSINQHDSLTDLFNRQYFNQLVSNDELLKDLNEVCIIFIDLDLFKRINDKYGHIAGDEVLQQFAQVLMSCCNNNEIVCRWGGEEFIIINPSSSLINAENLCKKIQIKMKKTKFIQNEKITCSFGIAKLKKGETIIQCAERADKKLLQAKASGRNQIVK